MAIDKGNKIKFAVNKNNSKIVCKLEYRYMFVYHGTKTHCYGKWCVPKIGLYQHRLNDINGVYDTIKDLTIVDNQRSKQGLKRFTAQQVIAFFP